MQREYLLENKRQAKRRKSKQGAFEFRFVSLDKLMRTLDESEKCEMFSDRGAGARAVYAACDGLTPESVYERRLKVARERLRRKHPELLDVFNLIVKNGSNRKESIWWLILNRRRNGSPQECFTGDT